MILIENIKTGETVEITEEKWVDLKKLGWKSSWRKVAETAEKEPLKITPLAEDIKVEIIKKKEKKSKTEKVEE